MGPPLPDDRLGRYERLRELGRGGHGVVHEARVVGPDGTTRRVALKVLSRAGERLVREARIGGLLRHVHLVDVYEVGEQDGVAFCAMELCDGGALDRYLPLPARAVIEVGLQVCDALAYAHAELGLVHLDLKPSNLLVSDGLIKVGDLGVARARGFDVDRRALGTRGFMAPEQAAGGAVDHRADIYGLGATLLALATGARGTSGATLTVDDDPLEPAEDDPTPLAWLQPILDRCLDPDPAQRFSSMDELAAALRAVEVEGPGLDAVIGPVPQARPTHRPTDAFVGRARERTELLAALRAPGLVTLRGPPGIGKSRLAREGARSGEGRRTWWVDLGGARTRDDLLGALASVFGVALGRVDEGTALELLAHALGSAGPALVVLDPVEHLVAHADLVASLTERTPGARWLATSHVPLGVGAERVVDVPPLDEADAVALLVDRARSRGVDVAHDPVLPELARQLDGLPLALELAAGRFGVLGPADVLERFGLSLLRSGRAEADRRATLTGALDCAWGLLSPVERSVLAQVSVFRGAFDLASAEAVAQLPAGTWVVDVLHALLERSLVARRRGRFLLLNAVRAYATRHQADPAALRDRHAREMARTGERWWSTVAWSPEDASRDGYLPDLEAACAHALASGDARSAVGALAGAWVVRDGIGPYGPFVALAERVAAMPMGPELAAVVDTTLARALTRSGRGTEAAERLEARLALDPVGGRTARVRCALAAAYLETGQPVRARALLEPMLADGGRWGDDVTMTAHSLRGIALLREGRPAEAAEDHDRELDLARRLGALRHETVAHVNAGLVRSQLGDDARAIAHLEQALAGARQMGNRRAAGLALGNLGNLHREGGDLGAARAAYVEAIGLLAAVGERVGEGVFATNLAIVERQLGRRGEAHALLARAIALQQACASPRNEAFAWVQRGLTELDDGDVPAAERSLGTARGLHERAGDAIWIAVDRAYLGRLALLRGDVATAAAALAEAIPVLEARRPLAAASFLLDRAEVRAAEGDLAGALILAERGVDVVRDGDPTVELATALARRARLLARAGQTAAAGRLLDEARTVAPGAEALVALWSTP